ncbi:sensor histidine kinase [Treponema sp. OMZ 792]|uniref:sensor histidine kinase n=1 Tax=unclassified Treponema TaxID=2638727 RepID=UPI0020A28E72|nr:MULTISPECIES: sensor histidine kinase [unclassified Treponema]UTC74628.1 sensor histidine kinase [Treponema sp. OMZ 792]UTC81025.1 HAMP domain-containing histidine kinase [Treponema sp. OMZ 798]
MKITEAGKLKINIIIKSFFKDNFLFIFTPSLLILVQVFILYLSNAEKGLASYISSLSISILIIFVILKFIFYYRKNTDYFDLLENCEINSGEISLNDEDFYSMQNLSLSQIIALSKIKKILLEREGAIYENRKMLIDQNDYFSLWIHQIKTPITSINILLQNMNSSKDEIFEIKKALLNIDNYTQMALHYLKLQRPDRDLDFSNFNLNDVLQNIFRKYRSIFIYKNIELNYKPCDLNIISDPVLFELMIEQIVSNSLKYCGIEGKKGILSIYIENRNPSVLVIEDNGIGISPSDLPKIFDKGYSGLNGRLSEKATGLGLYLAREIAERLNCELSIDSLQGEWTKARIKLGGEVLEHL